MSNTWIFALVTGVGAVLVGGRARGDESPYCREVHAQAAADVALLRWPRLYAEGIRFPASNRLDLGPTVGNNYQGRLGMAFSPLDIYRGELVSRVSDADCASHEAAARIDDALVQLDEAGKRTALREQAAFLDAHRGEWQALVAKAARRFDARVITRIELHELRWMTEILERRLAQVHSEARRLEAAVEPPRRVGSLAALTDGVLSTAGARDEAVVQLRALDAWSFKVTGGVIPMPGRPFDWFGLAEIGYNLGGIQHDRQLAVAAAARAEGLRTERRELPARIAKLRREIVARIAGVAEELKTVEAQLAVAVEAGRALDTGEPEGPAAHARDTLVIERLSVEADRVFLRTLLGELTAIVEASGGAS